MATVTDFGMQIGVGLDANLNLTFDEQAALSKEAARLGYTSIHPTPARGRTPRTDLLCFYVMEAGYFLPRPTKSVSSKFES